MELTTDFIGGSFIFALVGYFIALLFQLYMMYLNWKQSKVNNQMDELIREIGKLTDEVKDIRKLIEKKKK
ncbi:hypothetical protein JW930_02155 [Candidatus Woesearchaeota archaeon]|nr:hypothetical protein [Candidatus Woesearchaeota archaeon]